MGFGFRVQGVEKAFVASCDAVDGGNLAPPRNQNLVITIYGDMQGGARFPPTTIGPSLQVQHVIIVSRISGLVVVTALLPSPFAKGGNIHPIRSLNLLVQLLRLKV